MPSSSFFGKMGKKNKVLTSTESDQPPKDAPALTSVKTPKGVLNQAQWEEVLTEAQQETGVQEIASKLVKEKVQVQDLVDLTSEEFSQLGISALGVRKALQRISRERWK